MEDDQTSEREAVEHALEGLDLVVLVRDRSRRQEGFRLVGSPPSWFVSCFGSAAALLQESLFLEDFVSGGASDCWDDGHDRVVSGLWEEEGNDGKPHYFEARALKQGSDEILVIALADERHQREKEFLQHAHDEALSQRRLAREMEKKEILLDCIVHDLGGPISTILMNIQHVARQVDRADLRRSLERAENQAERQRGLIRSIADMFSSDLATFEEIWRGNRGVADVREVAGEIVGAYKTEAERFGVRLELEAGNGGGATTLVAADRRHVERVIENLLSNALRHAPEGTSVTVGVSTEGGCVRTTVEDAGPGLSPEQWVLMFLPLSERTDRWGSSHGEEGLGLYFCKMTVELWGGSIGVEQGSRGGSCFWFELPSVAGRSAGKGLREVEKGGDS